MMNQTKLLQSADGKQIIRVLDTKGNKALIIDCIHPAMPLYVDVDTLSSYVPCDDDTLCEKTGYLSESLDGLSPLRRKTALERYTVIAGVLASLSDAKVRSAIIARVAEANKVSKQTVRAYLQKYLIYQDIGALADKEKKARELTDTEKTMRWALNRFYYTQHKNSLPTAYAMMLKEKYTDENGELLEHPTISQFKYFYRTHRKMENYFISRNGLKDYQMNDRPLLGDGLQQLAPNIGTAFLDGTICDIYLVNDQGQLVGRPVLVAAVDVNTSLCLGYALLWEGGVYSLQQLMLSILSDKVKLCRSMGIVISSDQWSNTGCLPGKMYCDRGSEYVGSTFEQITELGITLVELPSFRAELKGSVERFFGLVQDSYKTVLKGRGVVMPDYEKRGSHDYRKDAVLTMQEFHRIIVRCIVHYNSERVITSYPYTADMLERRISPHAADIWNYKVSQAGANMIPVSEKELIMTLLPRTEGTFSRYGFKVNGLRYHAEGYKERYLSGGKAVAAYNPDDASMVWLKEKDGRFVAFSLIESRFEGKSLVDIQEEKRQQKHLVNDATEESYKAKVELMRFIESVIAGKAPSENVQIKGARAVRSKERRKAHKALEVVVDE